MSFRKYGGINHAAKNNIVKSHYSTSDNQTISNTLGQTNTKIVSKSHLDMGEHSLLNLRSVYFMDGTVQYTAYPGLANGDLEVKGNLIVDGSTTLSGSATAPTLSIGNNSTHIATTSFVQSAINQITLEYAKTVEVTAAISQALINIHLPDYANLNADVSFNSIQFKTGAAQDEPLLPTINILPTAKNQSTFVTPSDDKWVEYQYPSNIKINKFGQIVSIQDRSLSSSDTSYNGWTLEDTDKAMSTRSNLTIGSDGNTNLNIPIQISTLYKFATLFNDNVQTLHIGGSTSSINMGSNTTTTRIRGTTIIASNPDGDDELVVVPGKISTTTTGSSYLFDTNTTTLNIGGEATNINLGAPNGKTVLRASLDVSGNTKLYGSLNVQSDASFNTINLNNGNFKVDISGNIRTQGSLNVESDASFGTINLNNGNFKVDSSGNTVTLGSLNVQGDASFNTINLNNGNFKVDSSGNTITHGSLNVQGDASFNTISLNNGNFKVDISGNTKVEGTLTVTKDLLIIGNINHITATVNSVNLLVTDKTITLNKNGDSSSNLISYDISGCGFYFEECQQSTQFPQAGSLLINSDRNDFEVVLPGPNWANPSGPRKMLLHRSGFTTQIDGSLDVSSNANIRGTLDVSSITKLNNTLDVSGNTKIKSSLNVQSDASFGTINLNSGNFNVDVSGNTTVKGQLNVKNDTTITGILDVSGNTKIKSSLNVQSDASFGTINLNSGNFNVDISGNTTVKGQLNVKNDTTITGILDVSGNTNIKSSLNVQSDASFGTINLNNGKFNVDILGNTNASGNLYVKKDALIDGSLNVTTGIISTTQTGTALLFDTNATTLKIGGQATAITMGSTSGSLTINSPVIYGQSTQNLFNTLTTQTLNIGGVADINMGGNGKKITINSPNVVGTQSPQYLFNTSQTQILYIATDASAVNIGSASGTLNVCQNKFIFSSDGAMNLNSGKFIYSADGAMNLNSGKFTVDNSGNTSLNGPFNVSNGIINTLQTGTATLFDANTTTLKIGGAATSITMGSTSGSLTINNPTVVGSQTTQNLFNTVATTLNIGAAASTVNIGPLINNSTKIYTGELNVSTGIITTEDTGTATLFNTNTKSLQIGGAATNITMGSTSGSLTINNPNVVGSQTTQNLFNTGATTLNIGGDTTTVNIGSASGTFNLFKNKFVVSIDGTMNLNSNRFVVSIDGTMNLNSNRFVVSADGAMNLNSGKLRVESTGALYIGNNFTVDSLGNTTISNNCTLNFTKLSIGGSITSGIIHVDSGGTISSSKILIGDLDQSTQDALLSSSVLGLTNTTPTFTTVKVLSTFIGDLSGNAKTASKLNNTLTIDGRTFNGSTDMSFTTAQSIGLDPSFTTVTATGTITASTIRANTTFIGDLSGNATNAGIKTGNNTAIGYNVLNSLITGSSTNGLNNTAIGCNTLNGVSVGNNNTAIGYNADVSGNNLRNSIAIGANAKVTTSNTIQLGDEYIADVFTKGNITTTFGNITTGGTITGANFSGTMINITSANFGTATATTGFFGDLSGNANTATTLKTSRKINGIDFDGSKDISFNITSSSGTNIGTDPSFNTVKATTFIGDLSGNAPNAGIKNNLNTAIGYQSLNIISTGTNNTSIGYQSLTNITTGSNNTAIGYKADVNAINLSNSTAIGANAVVDASNTIQLGASTITNVKTSGKITAGGTISTSGDITASGNITAGTLGTITGRSFSGTMITTATANFTNYVNSPLFIGDLSGNAPTATKVSHKLYIGGKEFDGSTDISVNITSGTTFNTGILAGYNTAIGDGALSKNSYTQTIVEITETFSTTGIGNVAIGSQSLLNNINGSFNTAVGCMAVNNDASFNGNKNTTIGAFSDISGNIENSTAIGANAIVDASNTIQLGDGNIDYVKTNGIITSSKGLKISNAITLTGSTGNIDTLGKITASDFSGNFSGGSVTTTNGFFNAIGVGSNITQRQFSVDSTGIVTAPKLSVSGDASFNKIYGGSSGAFFVDSSGNTTVKSLKISEFTALGIAHIDTTGTISNSKIVTADLEESLSNLLSVTPSFSTINATGNIESNSTTIGTIIVTGGIGVSGKVTASSFNATSDYRVKENVQQLDPTLFNVDKLNPVTYNKIDSGKQDIGFIAHEVQEVFPFLVTGEKDGEQTQSLNYLGLIGVLVKEIQELKKRVVILENR